MEFDCRTVERSRIRCLDETFRISTHSSADALRPIIERVGLINRPILLSEKEEYLIVTGFARIDACRQLGWAQIPARCALAQTSRRQLALIAVADNAHQRPLNVVEQARAHHLLSQMYSASDAPSEIFMAAQSAGVDLNADLAEKLSLVYRMSDTLQSGLIDGTLALPVALRLISMGPPESVDSLAAFIRELRLGLNRQRELLDWIEAICHRERIAIADILLEEQIAKWRCDLSMDAPRKSNLIRLYLKSRRYPTLSEFEQRYGHYVKKLHIINGIELVPPAHFEGRAFSLKIEFSNPEELTQGAAEIGRLSQSAIMRELLDQPLTTILPATTNDSKKMKT